MACEICRRGNCTRSFHTIEEQSEFDNTADSVKERMKTYFLDKVYRLRDHGTEEQGWLVSYY